MEILVLKPFVGIKKDALMYREGLKGLYNIGLISPLRSGVLWYFICYELNSSPA